jgi:queuine tRNA-ribosyltransferase
MKFTLQANDSKTKARTGVLHTGHGEIPTPIFMPVGTAGTVKTIHQHELEKIVEAKIILANTYHLFLRPGIEIIEASGGLHRFIGWEKPILTDSGGYQVFSLAEKRKVSEEGVTFQSHIDGNKLFFSPESVIDSQRKIGADIIMAFDECTPYPCDYAYAKNSMELTHRWLTRCINQFDQTKNLYHHNQLLFPIVQGSVYSDLRTQSAEFVAAQNCDGNAIGGLSVGEPVEMMYETVNSVCEILPQAKPRYLMGVGTPQNLLECIALGIDMFDCVLPTRNARHGIVYTKTGVLHIRNEKWKNDFSPIEEENPVLTGSEYSKAYLRHLFISDEILGKQIASLYNLHFYLWLVGEARNQIMKGEYEAWKNKMVIQLSAKR